MLIGPGRWGTTTPSLGVPVDFSAINNVDVLCELAEMHEGLVPDVSLGTHFFNDLVELDILYLAIYPQKKENVIGRDFFMKAKNRLSDLLPEYRKWADVIRVIDTRNIDRDMAVYLNVNSIEQRGVCYKDRKSHE